MKNTKNSKGNIIKLMGIILIIVAGILGLYYTSYKVSNYEKFNIDKDRIKTKQTEFAITLYEHKDVEKIKNMKREIGEIMEKNSSYIVDKIFLENDISYVRFASKDKLQKVKNDLNKYGKVEKWNGSVTLF
ncbi:hypothetical protein [Bacillus cereus]|uniref:hypothetical protein n=1 Tax=Bacillus cereus TaxID=1396 RepID=UPI000B4A78B0|nr:hypothetical protein [Bacillus cereus]